MTRPMLVLTQPEPAMTLNRRSFLIGAALLPALPRMGIAAAPGLTVQSRVIEVLGRAASVYGITGPDGRPGLWAREGDRFPGPVQNLTELPQVMHWHGQTLAPWDQDRARPGGGALAPGATDHFDFALTPGTHWMHSHELAEQRLLAAPMVCARTDEVEAEATVMLHDFAFRSPEEILAELGGSDMHAMPATGQMDATMDHSAMDMGAMMTHANDVAYDAYLANDRTLDDPEVIAVEPGPFRLRLINGATATAFWIDTGALQAQVVAVDGNPVVPLAASVVPLAQGQRIDLMLMIPPEGGAFPILAQVEQARFRTGVILVTPGARIDRLTSLADADAPALDLALEQRLTSPAPLPDVPGKMLHLTLGMEPGYRWTINGRAHGEAPPFEAALGSRVELMFMNPTPMMHPMHLHGHHFQVVDAGKGRFSGALRDVIVVPPMAMVTVAVDFTNPGEWFLHCHHLYHMATGMMTSVKVA